MDIRAGRGRWRHLNATAAHLWHHLAAGTSPRAVALTCLLQLVSGAVTAFGLYATTSALTPLLAAGPTAERVRDALPALIVTAAAACARSVVAALTVATTARIGPRVDGMAETRYLEATTKAPLACYDDPAWSDQSEAASRAAKDVHLMVEAFTAVTTALLCIVAAAGIMTHLHPALLPLMLLAVVPRGWAAVRAARAAYFADRHTLADRRGTDKWYVCTFIADRPVRSVKAKIRTLTHRTSQQDLAVVLVSLNQVAHGWANYFRHAVAKRTFSNLDNLVWWRVIRLLQERHHRNWTDVRRRLSPTGRWRPISAGEIELRKISAIPATRYRYRGNTIPTPWTPATT
ncbi:group II intron maturase-specific domain-containing protein [Streptomyces sp. MP131-18]|uniref:group II intron maturase-specific domain-containing protein n=1 Tax=Streptomyces sp. MP131-18 TaxID=1857892 RepID=UPI0009C8D763|nr:group II intron maturase-specific domain-containing protein [Streptomyces sp. MP131-18]ONK11223.1 Group II intron, maturase-specific domain [Streptomyces sp. MP131-18]